MKELTLGSLFDGIGGFPLAGCMLGIEPKWCAEIEPFPAKVTESRFPTMKQLGDVSFIDGYSVEPVDIISFGSPCQDLSVAGKRSGLKHSEHGDEETTRSGLFYEAVRIIKEIRNADTNNSRPNEHIRHYGRFAIWENVPGAFSSNNGEDFRCVLEELAKVKDERAYIPLPPDGKWHYNGQIVGDTWSIAWRVLDAQFWGVAQRRRRVFLVADFDSRRAGDILFKQEGLSRHFATCKETWERISGSVEDCVGVWSRTQ